MPLPSPPVALLSYRQLVREALERVPSHTPEWTNLNDADPGVTIVQLFAFLTETLSYRADLVPERNRRKFLQLLDVPLQPAQPALGLVAFSNPRGPLAVTQLPQETEVLAGKVPFRTVTDLTVLPIDSRLYQKARLDDERVEEVKTLYRRLYGDLTQSGARLDFYETRPFDPPTTGATSLPDVDLGQATTDGALWIALLARATESPDQARAVIANKVLTLAVLPAVAQNSLAVPARRNEAAGASANLEFHLPRKSGANVAYDLIEARPSADLALNPGTVELRLPGADRLTWIEDMDPLEPGVGDLPPSLSETEDGERLITWIRVRAPEGAARLSGIWINGVEVSQRAWVPAETLPPGTGEPNQRAIVVNTPVLPGTEALVVNGERWQRVDDLYTAGPEIEPPAPRLAEMPRPRVTTSKAYTLDPESGEIRFGDGFTGMRPPRGATIVISYAYGGGQKGVVGIGAISKGPALPAGIQVRNPAPTWGGGDAETVADAEFRIPRWLRHRDRLVTEEDFHEIAWATPGVVLGRVEVMPLYHPSRGALVAPGAVTLMVVPLVDAAHPDAPQPDRLFLEAVCRHLEPRRLVTTELFLSGPEYRDLIVSAGVDIVPGQAQGPVLDEIAVEIRRFLSPLAGGFDGRGWPLEKAVDAGEVLAAVARVPGVARVVGLLLGNLAGDPIASLPIDGLQLPRLAGVSVTTGAPAPLAAVAGVPTGDAAPRRLPVPVIPEEC